jgi:hypothetical protein
MFWLPAIASHRGDGVFQDISWRAGVLAVSGYCISMPEFDLAKPHQAEYGLGGLTNIGRQCGVHLAIRDPDYRWGWDRRAEQLGARVQLELLNSQGQPVVNVSGRLGDYIWSGFRDLDVLYQRDKSFFKPDSTEEYRLRVAYEPDSRLAGFKGLVFVRSGGSK